VLRIEGRTLEEHIRAPGLRPPRVPISLDNGVLEVYIQKVWARRDPPGFLCARLLVSRWEEASCAEGSVKLCRFARAGG